MPYLAELRSRLGTFTQSLRRRHAFADLLEVEVEQDVAADAAAEQDRVARLAYAAQQADIEAARLIEAAQAPDSEGGRVITPREAAPVIRCITRSARRDHQITEVFHV